MGSPITLTRDDFNKGLLQVNEACTDGSYLDKFKIVFPDGLNTASTLEICRVIQNADLETKIALTRICIAGRNVEVTCPNGEVEKFCMQNVSDGLEGFPLFKKEPLALIAISDAIYGYILKKSVRLSTAQTGAATTSKI